MFTELVNLTGLLETANIGTPFGRQWTSQDTVLLNLGRSFAMLTLLPETHVLVWQIDWCGELCSSDCLYCISYVSVLATCEQL